MRAVVQRVSSASVEYDSEGKTVKNQIGKGFQVMLGISQEDTKEDLVYIIEKIVGLRVFEDSDGKMNLSIKDIGGEILMVSQFTLYGDARKGRRPSFSDAARPEIATPLYEAAIDAITSHKIHCETGLFGADMQVNINNDGPVTILLDSTKLF